MRSSSGIATGRLKSMPPPARLRVPFVTTCELAAAAAGGVRILARMSPALNSFRATCRELASPLSLAGIGTWGLIAFEQIGALWRREDARLWPVAATLLVFLAAFLGREFLRSAPAQRAAVLLQLAAALANIALVQSGSGPILGVIVAAQLPFVFGAAASVAIVVGSLLAHAWMFHARWEVSQPLFTAALFGGFQFFALLTARLAHGAEQQRDQLAQVNAQLLATRSLLEAGARDGERLRLSRELHDVAGHSLTALKLNLELGLRLPEPERAARIEAARDLVDALLEDIRAVVGQLRRHDGVDLAPALRALIERVPGPQVELDLDPELRVALVAQAEALLRCVQEALTNALRHSGARHVRISVRREGQGVRVAVEDDGRGRSALAPGLGLTGMRERIEEAGGELEIDTAPGRGFRLRALLPQVSET
jgi:signal transduction histidine kinase